MEWKTIDTAPKDLILVCDFSLDPEDYEGSIAVVWWEPYRNSHDAHKWIVSTCAEHEEFEVVSYRDTPTHWMPLPNPPEHNPNRGV